MSMQTKRAASVEYLVRKFAGKSGWAVERRLARMIGKGIIAPDQVESVKAALMIGARYCFMMTEPREEVMEEGEDHDLVGELIDELHGKPLTEVFGQLDALMGAGNLDPDDARGDAGVYRAVATVGAGGGDARRRAPGAGDLGHGQSRSPARIDKGSDGKGPEDKKPPAPSSCPGTPYA